MKSYYTLEDCILNKKSNDFIFKQDKLKKREYSSGNLEEIKKFQQKHGCDLFEYIDYNKSIRLFFYIHLQNIKNNFDEILNNVIRTLKLNYQDLIIIQETEYIYRIVHKYLYVDCFEDLDQYLFRYNLFNINLKKEQFIPSILNKSLILKEKYDFYDSILNNTESLLKLNTKTTILTKTIKSQYIQNIEFDNYNTLFIKSSMGSGKSTSTVEYIKKHNIKSFLILSCRRTLTYTIYDKLKQNNIDVDNYITTNKTNIKISERLIISPDSICKLDFPLQKFEFIWIDEGVSFMYYIGNHLCIDKNTKTEVLYIIEWLLKNCHKLLITDADLNNHTIQYYLYYRNIQNCLYLQYKNASYVNKYHIFDTESETHLHLEENIKMGKKIYICCDTLSKTKNIYEYIINLNIITSENILLYNSESNHSVDKAMYDVNDFWKKFTVVIVSPKVVFGVDFNLEYFDCVYGFYKCTTLNVREAFQQIHRIRNIKSKMIYIFIYEKTNLHLENTLNSIKYNVQTYKLNNLFYKKTKIEIDHIVNCITYNIDKNGYKYMDMNSAMNYLIMYCIYECNNSLNDFMSIFKQQILLYI